MPECFYVNNCFFELVQQFYHATEIGRHNAANAATLALISISRQNKCNFLDKVNYLRTKS